MNSGTFCWVYAAVDCRTGEPLAVEELVIKGKHIAEMPDLKIELEISRSFKVC